MPPNVEATMPCEECSRGLILATGLAVLVRHKDDQSREAKRPAALPRRRPFKPQRKAGAYSAAFTSSVICCCGVPIVRVR
jgi:hypothetical protein